MLIIAAPRSRAYSNDVKKLLVCAAVAPLLLALGMSTVLNVFAPWYMLFIGPPLALLAVLVIWPNAAGTLGFYRQPRLDVFDWRMVSRRLAARAQGSDAIVFLPGFSRIMVTLWCRSRGCHRV